MPIDITTPVGRIVWGDLLKGQPVTDDNNQPVMGADGQQRVQHAFGLAIPKAQCNDLFTAMTQEANAAYPNGVPGDFSYKFKDGDDPNFAGREGYAGHYVFTIATELGTPNIVKLVNGQYVVWTEIKRGDYARAALTIKGHTGNPTKRGSRGGLYFNPQGVEFIGYGEPIFSGPSAQDMFGGQAVALPPGASTTPVASSSAPGMAVPQANPMQPGGIPAQGAMPAMPQQPPMAQPTMQPAQAATHMQYPSNPPMGGAPAPTAPVGVPQQAPVGVPAQPTAYPTNPAVQPAHDFVQNAVGGVPGMIPGQVGQQ